MKILAIDTSALVASVAVIDEEKLLGEYILNSKKTHSQTLMPMIQEVLKSAELELKEVDAIAVAKGPGSFTGLRIGAATAKGLAYAAKKPLIGVSTLEGLAYNLSFTKYQVCPIMDAKRNQVYTAIYKWKGQNYIEKLEPSALQMDQLLEILQRKNKKVVFIGDGIPVYKQNIIEALGEKAFFALPSTNMQKASSIGLVALEKARLGDYEDVYSFAPVYLRKSQAEREYEERHGKSVEE